jgi:hypothetical protein
MAGPVFETVQRVTKIFEQLQDHITKLYFWVLFFLLLSVIVSKWVNSLVVIPRIASSGGNLQWLQEHTFYFFLKLTLVTYQKYFLLFRNCHMGELSSSVSIVWDWMDDSSFDHHFQTGSGVHRASSLLHTEGPVAGGKTVGMEN